jgi:hypothetical protein
MRKRMWRWAVAGGIGVLCAGGVRAVEPANAAPGGLTDLTDAHIRLMIGAVSDIQGLVEETTRTFYDVSGQPEKQELAERYDLQDFGMDDTYPVLGVGMEWIWRYITLQWDLLFMNPDTDTVAQRNYYIGVGEDIQFEGQGYDNLLIPEGTPFSMELLGAVTELRMLYTPVTFQPAEGVLFTPFLGLGLFLFGGYYEIDAGQPQGVTQYLNPPEDFVIGGASEGYVGIGLPEYGGGAEVRFGRPGRPNVVLQGQYLLCDISGSTKYLTSSSHREKDAEIDHTSIWARGLLEFPMQSGRRFFVGVQYQQIESNALISSTGETEEEILEKRERFDKRVAFEMTALTALVGITF